MHVFSHREEFSDWKDGEERPSALLARRAPTMKRWSLDARSEDHTSRLAGCGR